MFDFDAGKLIVIGIVALIVIGPKELPRVLRQLGQAVGKLRRMAGEFQGQFMDAMKEADIQNLKEEAEKLAASTKLDMGLDPVSKIGSDITASLESKPPSMADVSAEDLARFDVPLDPEIAPPTSETIAAHVEPAHPAEPQAEIKPKKDVA
jgi:sec-independent protein translocase protein TatB